MADSTMVDSVNNNDKVAQKTKTVYTKAQLIKRIAQNVRVRHTLVEKIYNGLEDEIKFLLASADENNDISLRLFEGFTIDSEYLSPHEKMNNLTGETITTLAKIKPRAKFTRYYSQKLIDYYYGENEND